jgi:formate hydrogenlyase subunit 3/multisubunit Na+/H+ antiporter MnhD subunit
MLVLLLAQAGVPFTSGFLGKFYVINAAVERGQYSLAVIAMLAAAVAAFFYLRVALLMYSGESKPAGDGSAQASARVSVPDVGGAQATDGAGDRVLIAGLEPIPSLDGPSATVALAAPPKAPVSVPFFVSLSLVVCVGFTIFAGVSSPMINFARDALPIL